VYTKLGVKSRKELRGNATLDAALSAVRPIYRSSERLQAAS
jgi:hypothetical protein